jgi:phage baseplate assembly protein V
MNAEQLFTLADIARRLTQIVRYGVVDEVDYENAKVKVKIEENVTGWRPWVTQSNVWNPPKIGEQVTVLSPNGEFEQSVVLPAMYDSVNAAVSSKDDVVEVKLDTDCLIAFQKQDGDLRVELPRAGCFQIGTKFISGDQNTGLYIEDGLLAISVNGQQFKISLEDGFEMMHSSDGLPTKNDPVAGVVPLVSPPAFAMTNDRIVFKVGTQELKLTGEGAFLNDFPLVAA